MYTPTPKEIRALIEKNLKVDITQSDKTLPYAWGRCLYARLCYKHAWRSYHLQQFADEIKRSHSNLIYLDSKGFEKKRGKEGFMNLYKELDDELTLRSGMLKATDSDYINALEKSIRELDELKRQINDPILTQLANLSEEERKEIDIKITIWLKNQKFYKKVQ